MATEPTLGRRIMIEATICKDAPPGSAMASKAWADLRALCARANAAERLAVATDALDRDDWREVDADGVPLVANEHANALAAWRALGEGSDGAP